MATIHDITTDRKAAALRYDAPYGDLYGIATRVAEGDALRDVTDAELTSRVQHLMPEVQDLVDQALERQAHLDLLRQQREAACAGQSTVPPSPPFMPPADLQALIQQAVQEALAAQQPPSKSQAPGHGTALAATPPASPEDWCPLHQVAMEQRSNATCTWYSHWVASAQRSCKGKEPCNRAEGESPPPPPVKETAMLRMERSPYRRLWAMWDDQDLGAILCQQHSRLPHPLASAIAQPSTHVAWCWGHTRLGSPRHMAGVRRCRVSGVPLDEADAWSILSQQRARLGPDGSTMARERARASMLGCVTVFGLLLGASADAGWAWASCCTGWCLPSIAGWRRFVACWPREWPSWPLGSS